MNTTTRWALKDSPYKVRFKKQGEKIHPEIKMYSDLSDESMQKCAQIKAVVHSVLPKAKVYLFGSRINGRWTDESDYDIIVLWMATPQERELLQSYNFGFEVDFCFSHSYNTSNYVEI